MDLTIYSDVPKELPGTYCRFCFRPGNSSETSLVPLFHPTTSEPLNLELITDCTGILLRPEVDFLSAVCQSCLQLMQEFRDFRRRAREYDKIIRAKVLPRIEPEVIIVKQEELEHDHEEFVCEPDHESTGSSTLTADESHEEQMDFLGRLQQLHQQHQMTQSLEQEQEDDRRRRQVLPEQQEPMPEEPKFSMSAIFNAQAAVAAVAAAAAAAAGTPASTHKRGLSRRMPTIGSSVSQAQEENRCMVCGEKFRSRDIWMAHLTVHAVERPFQCHICLAQFKTKYVQQNHIRTVHENVRSYRCPICSEPSRMFKSKRTLEDHMRYHTGERPFVCSICKMSFSSGSVHRNHMYRVHREMRKKDRRCSYCSKVFDRILDLKRHQTSYCEKIISHEMVQRL